MPPYRSVLHDCFKAISLSPPSIALFSCTWALVTDSVFNNRFLGNERDEMVIHKVQMPPLLKCSMKSFARSALLTDYVFQLFPKKSMFCKSICTSCAALAGHAQISQLCPCFEVSYFNREIFLFQAEYKEQSQGFNNSLL